MEVKIREINENDYPAVLTMWNNELGNTNVTEENIAHHYERMGRSSGYKTSVAVAGKITVGFITTVETMAAGFDAGYLKINGLAVLKNFQKKGIGAKLMKHVEDYAAGKGLSSIILNSGFK